MKTVKRILYKLSLLLLSIIAENYTSSKDNTRRKVMETSIFDRRNISANLAIEPEYVTVTVRFPRKGITKTEREIVKKLATDALGEVLSKILGNEPTPTNS